MCLRVLCTALLLAAVPALVRAADQPLAKEDVNSPDEPLAKEFSLPRAVAFLDSAALAWTRDRKCGSCHTNYPYLMVRATAATWPSAALSEVRKFVEDRAAHWETAKPRWDAEVVMTAAALAFDDACRGGKLQPLTRQALDRMWKLQKPDGGWNWLKCNWPPMELDDYYGALMAALAVGQAGPEYARTEPASRGLHRLRGYFRKNSPPSLHHHALLLWAAQKVDGLMTPAEQKLTVAKLVGLQRPDGGWNLPSLGAWKRHNGKPNDPGGPSDGYATGLVLVSLRQAGVPASDKTICQGLRWLRTHQRESGRWFTRSVSNDRYHFITHVGTAYAVLALRACDP